MYKSGRQTERQVVMYKSGRQTDGMIDTHIDRQAHRQIGNRQADNNDNI